MIIQIEVILKALPAFGKIIDVDCDENGIPNGSNAKNWKVIFADFDKYKDLYKMLS